MKDKGSRSSNDQYLLPIAYSLFSILYSLFSLSSFSIDLLPTLYILEKNVEELVITSSLLLELKAL